MDAPHDLERQLLPLPVEAMQRLARHVIEQRKHHTTEAKRLRMLAPSLTAAPKARVLQQAQEHAVLAGLPADALNAGSVVGS